MIAVIGVRDALAGPVIREIDVPLTDLAPELEGLRIVQLSDLHIGPTIRRGYIERVVERTMALKPDLIVSSTEAIML